MHTHMPPPTHLKSENLAAFYFIKAEIIAFSVSDPIILFKISQLTNIL